MYTYLLVAITVSLAASQKQGSESKTTSLAATDLAALAGNKNNKGDGKPPVDVSGLAALIGQGLSQHGNGMPMNGKFPPFGYNSMNGGPFGYGPMNGGSFGYGPGNRHFPSSGYPSRNFPTYGYGPGLGGFPQFGYGPMAGSFPHFGYGPGGFSGEHNYGPNGGHRPSTRRPSHGDFGFNNGGNAPITGRIWIQQRRHEGVKSNISDTRPSGGSSLFASCVF
ncbi:hypothetical protein COOONC_16339 [Cooperia oncophora]